MISRCTRASNSTGVARYQKRGIVICDRWRESFENFLADMGECPQNRSLDRVDNNGNYEPGNCRWATPQQQARNTRRNVWITYNGQRLHFIDACTAIGIWYQTIHTKMRRKGMTHQEAFDYYVARS